MEEILDRIFPDYRVTTFLHTTSEDFALLIMEHGLGVDENIHKTVDEVNRDTFFYWYKMRSGRYGGSTVVIQLPRGVALEAVLVNSGSSFDIVSKLIRDDSDIEIDSLLPNDYVIGFINRKKSFVENPHTNRSLRPSASGSTS